MLCIRARTMTLTPEPRREGRDASDPSPGPQGEPGPEAPQALTPQAVLEILAARHALNVRDQRLHALPGIVQAASELGVRFARDTITETDLPRFAEACRSCEYALAGQALAFIAAGRLDIEQGRLPRAREGLHTEALEPVSCYAASLELVDSFLDARKGRGALDPADLQSYRERCWSEEWREAVLAAEAFEEGLIRIVETADGGHALAGRQTSTFMLVYDAKRQAIGPFTTFHLHSRPLARDVQLQNRIVPPSAAERIALLCKTPEAQALPDTIIERYFGVREYPDRTRVENALVEHTAGVLPLFPGAREIHFRLAVDGGKQPYSIQILTGEGCHTPSPLYAERGGRVAFGLPSLIGPGEQFFSAKPADVLGAKRAETAELVGEEASTSIVLIIKPCVEGSRAAFRRELLAFKAGKITAAGFDAATSHISQHDSPEWLVENGHLTPEDCARIAEARRVRLEGERAEAEARAQTRKGFGKSLSLDLHPGERGGAEAFALRCGPRLHTGASGIASGFEFGVLRDRLEADPFAAPKIIVLHPYGIGGPIDPQAAAAQLRRAAGGPFAN